MRVARLGFGECRHRIMRAGLDPGPRKNDLFHDWTPPLVHGGNGYGTLFLMTIAEHGIYHCGGVLQMETHLGVPYRP
jgi:hypothetical protein